MELRVNWVRSCVLELTGPYVGLRKIGIMHFSRNVFDDLWMGKSRVLESGEYASVRGFNGMSYRIKTSQFWTLWLFRSIQPKNICFFRKITSISSFGTVNSVTLEHIRSIAHVLQNRSVIVNTETRVPDCVNDPCCSRMVSQQIPGSFQVQVAETVFNLHPASTTIFLPHLFVQMEKNTQITTPLDYTALNFQRVKFGSETISISISKNHEHVLDHSKLGFASSIFKERGFLGRKCTSSNLIMSTLWGVTWIRIDLP